LRDLPQSPGMRIAGEEEMAQNLPGQQIVGG
jgi:hypothetical protein